MIDELTDCLRSIYPGGIIAEDWIPGAVEQRLAREGVVWRPDPARVFYNVGEPYHCHATALHHKFMDVPLVHAGGVPYFGYSVKQKEWWVHSFVVDGGLFFDPARSSLPSIYFGIPWDVELFRALYGPEEELPAVLTAPAILTKKERQHESTLIPDPALSTSGAPGCACGGAR